MLPPLRVAIERCRQQTLAEWCKVPRMVPENVKTNRKVEAAASASAIKFVTATEKTRCNMVAWDEQEDKLLIDLATQKPQDWSKIATYFPNKTVKQCHDRWQSQLSPKFDHSPWSRAEEKLLTAAQSKFGTAGWASIAKFFPGRSAYAVKNGFHSVHRRRQNYQIIKNANIKTCSMRSRLAAT